MYKIGEKPHHRKKVYLVLLFLLVGLIIGGSVAAQQLLRSDTQLTQSEGIIRHVDVVTPATKQVTEPLFTMSIPETWKAVEPRYIPAAQYSWQGTSKDDTARWLDLYIDSIPSKMAVNRMIPLSSSGNKIIVDDSVSDNCVNFTDEKAVDAHTGTVVAKWSGVTFICDAANSLRNLTGTGSTEGINTLKLKGATKGTHQVFFVYTDHSGNPDYTPFTDALNSFELR